MTNRREGTFVIYSLADPHVRALLRQVLAHAGHDVEAAAAGRRA